MKKVKLQILQEEYESNSDRNQDINVTYNGFTDNFNVKVVASNNNNNNNGGGNNNNGGNNNGGNNNGGNGNNGGNTPSNKPSSNQPNNTNNGNNGNNGDNGNQENSVVANDNTLGNTELDNTKNTESSQEEEKPTAVLGAKIVKEDKNFGDFIKNNVISIVGISGCGILLLTLLAIALKKNLKIYIENNGVVIGFVKTKITKSNPVLDLDKYMDNYKIGSSANIYLNKSIAKRLNTETVIVRLNGKNTKHKIKYNGLPFKIEL